MRDWPVFLFLAVLALAGAMGVTMSAAHEPGVSRTLARERAAAFYEFSDLRAELRLRIPAEREAPVEGTIRFRGTQDAVRDFVLDFKEDAERVKDVRVGEASMVHDVSHEHITVPNVGTNIDVSVDFLAGELSLNRQEEFLYTLFVPDRARTVMPCIDQPDVKVRYTLEVEVPVGENPSNQWAVASAGPLLSSTNGVWRFGETKPLSTYQFAFAAGKFEVVQRGGMRFYHRETDAEKAERNMDAIFDLHRMSLLWLEEYTGMAYPFQTFDFVAVPGFPYAGMEHVGNIFYRSPFLFLPEGASQEEKLWRAHLIAHETAHAWFGNLVTMEWFDDVWLKEVFANYMAGKMVQPMFPEMDHELAFFLDHVPSAAAVDRSTGAHPILQRLGNLQDAGTIYGALIYHKAPLMMRQLELQMGEEALQAGIREYLEVFSFKNATWDELMAVLAKYTKDGFDIEAWSRAWVKEKGLPEVLVASSNSVTVVSGPPQVLEGKWVGDGKEGVWLPDAGGVYGRVLRADSERRWMLDALGTNTVGSALDRGMMMEELWEGFLHGEGQTTNVYDGVFAAIGVETNAMLRERWLSLLNKLSWRFLSTEERKARAETLETFLWERMESAEERGVKRTYYKALVRHHETASMQAKLREVLDGDVEIEGVTLEERDQMDLAFALAVRADAETAAEMLREQEMRMQEGDGKRRFEFVRRAVDPDAGKRRDLFVSFAEAENRRPEPWVRSCLFWLHHPLRQEAEEGGTVGWIRESLDWLEDVKAKGDIFFPQAWVAGNVSGHSSMEAAEVVRSFLDERGDLPGPLQLKVWQATDLLMRAAGR